MPERGSILGPERKWRQEHGLRTFVFVRPFCLFTSAQVLVLSAAIIRIGFDRTMAATSLAE